MGGLGEPASAATVINNIFRNYEHRWIYDFDEMRRGRRLGLVVPVNNCVARLLQCGTGLLLGRVEGVCNGLDPRLDGRLRFFKR